MSKMKLPDGWKYIKLSELFDEESEKNHSDAEVLTIVQGVGTVPRKDSGRDIIYDKNSLSNYKYVREDDFIIHLRSFEGGLEIANQEGIVSPAYIILHPKIQTEPGYLYTLFHSNRFINQTMAPAVEGVRDGRTVKYEVLKNQSIPFPPLAEQQKIAEILCRQDKIISLKQKLLEQKLQQKKWLMHKLLEVPHSNANCEEKVSLGGVVINKSEWKRDSLGNLGDFSKGSGIKREEANSGKIPAIRYGEIYTVHNEYIKIFYSFISNDVAKQSKLLKNGDLLFSCSGETKEDIGKCVAFVFNCEAYAGGDVIILSPKVTIDSMFFGFFLNSAFVNKQRFEFAQGDSIVHISSESLSKIKIYLPSLPEQKIIAQVLSTADKEIALLKSSIEQEKQKKKSLAQLLLTGTVRVNT